MLDLTDREEEAMAARRRDDSRSEFVRRLVRARCPEVTMDDLEAAFGDSANDDEEIGAAYADDAVDPNAGVLAQIADAIADAIEALEERLTALERDLSPRRRH